MKKFLAVAAIALVSTSLFAADREQMNIGKLYLNDTEVTATAAELNTLDASGTAAITVNKATIVSNATVGTTLGVTGVATFTATPVCKDGLTVQTNISAGGTVDAAAFTVDAGAGLDNQAAGALKLGASTATSVDIGDTGVTTTNKGPLTVNEAFISKTTGQIIGNTVLGGTLNVAGAATFSNSLAAASVAPANGFTTNIVIVSKDDKTNTFTFTSGVLTAFTLGQ